MRHDKKGVVPVSKGEKGVWGPPNPLFLLRCIRPEAMGPNKGSEEATKPPHSLLSRKEAGFLWRKCWKLRLSLVQNTQNNYICGDLWITAGLLSVNMTPRDLLWSSWVTYCPLVQRGCSRVDSKNSQHYFQEYLEKIHDALGQLRIELARCWDAAAFRWRHHYLIIQVSASSNKSGLVWHSLVQKNTGPLNRSWVRYS